MATTGSADTLHTDGTPELVELVASLRTLEGGNKTSISQHHALLALFEALDKLPEKERRQNDSEPKERDRQEDEGIRAKDLLEFAAALSHESTSRPFTSALTGLVGKEAFSQVVPLIAEHLSQSEPLMNMVREIGDSQDPFATTIALKPTIENELSALYGSHGGGSNAFVGKVMSRADNLVTQAMSQGTHVTHDISRLSGYSDDMIGRDVAISYPFGGAGLARFAADVQDREMQKQHTREADRSFER